MNSTGIHIPEPCPEKWSNMTPEGEGRFCASCEKVVVDFTSMTNAEIKNYFLHKPIEKTCGHFYNYQLQQKKQGDVRNKMLQVYAKLENSRIRKTPKLVSLFAIGIVLFVLGCRPKKLAGMPAHSHANIRNLDEPGYTITGDTTYVPQQK